METERLKDTRNTVINMLDDTLEKGILSDAVLDRALKAEDMDARDRAFIRHLYAGTLERLIYTDYIINHFSKTPTVKMKTQILNILRISVFQMLFMDGVPDRAAISEAVRLTAKRGFSGLKGFVNAVLRSIQKEKGSLEEGMPRNVLFSVPKWMYTALCDTYGINRAEAFLSGTLKVPDHITIRPNLARVTAKEAAAALESEGCSAVIDEGEDTISLKGFESLTGLKSFKQGLFSVQDKSSVEAALQGCRILSAKGCYPELIMDLCAAPGGKSICASQYFPKARVIAGDRDLRKKALIDENIKRLGLENIESRVSDARVMDEGFEGRADLVIADLPCSGLGVIGKKPDIRLRVRQKDISELAALQREILKNAWRYLKAGGILVYSTCTFTPEENGQNAEWLLALSGLKLLVEKQLLPEDGDGFYIAVFEKT